ncbi:MAG: protein jag [Lachnospiraceae bacterium]|nr:protein jag [Lachnospiraceae bacterium]
MNEFKQYSAKTVDDAITKALIDLGITSVDLEYEIVEKGSTGILGIFNAKPAVISARKKFVQTPEGQAVDFLNEMFAAMNMEVNVEAVVEENEGEKTISIDLSGSEMGVLIGKRGQTLDSIQYLASLVVNKDNEDYIRVKVDTENYRARRKATLEKLAKNIAAKVKRTRKSVALEPMNPYERRIIHSALQGDRYVTTKSEGEEPNRRVVISLKREKRERYNREK